MTERTKMTIKVYKPLWASFSDQLGGLPISRDQFLNKVIETEIPYLAEAMMGKKLSSKANRYISNELHRLPVTQINIGLDSSTAEDLNNVVKESHMVRDAFVNRLIAFLRSSDALLKSLNLPTHENGKVGRSYGEEITKPVSPLSSLVDIFQDPFWYLRMATKERHGTSMYLLNFPSPKMDGFACWIRDEDVPGTRANETLKRELDEMRKNLEDFESDALVAPKKL